MRTACRPLRVCLWKGSHSSITCSENSWFWDVNPLLGSQSALPGSTQGLQVAAGGQPTPGNTVSIMPFPGVPWGWAIVGPVSQGPLDSLRLPQGLCGSVPLLDCRVGPLSARAIAVLVHHSGDELRCEGDDHPVGNDRQHADYLQHQQPGPWATAGGEAYTVSPPHPPPPASIDPRKLGAWMVKGLIMPLLVAAAGPGP